MRTIRVCHLGKYYPPAPGGIESHVQTLAQAQADLGMDVRVFCVNHRPGPTVVEMDGEVEVTRFGRAASITKLDLCPDLPGALARVEADILHMNVPNPTMILAVLAARPAQPIVVTYQSDVIHQRVRGWLFRPLERLAYRRVPVVLQSSPLYAGGSSFLRSYRDRLDLLPNGVDLSPYLDPAPGHVAEAARIRDRHPGPLWVGCGRMVYYKGFSVALKALRQAPGTLILVGGGPLLEALKREAAELGVADRVVFTGSLPHYHDIIPYYLAADAFWFPSNARSEAFGIVQVEAMACGTPVINTAIPHSGVPWVSLHDETGLTVPVDDPAALAEAAVRLAEEPGLRDRLGKAARARAIREFDHRTMAARSLAIYQKVLAIEPDSQPAGRPVLVPGP